MTKKSTSKQKKSSSITIFQSSSGSSNQTPKSSKAHIEIFRFQMIDGNRAESRREFVYMTSLIAMYIES